MSEQGTSARVGDAVLLALATTGPQPTGVLPRLCGLDASAVETEAGRLREAGLLEERARPSPLLALSQRGRARVEDIVGAERVALGAMAAALYERFRPLNRLAKDAVSRWQMRTVGGVIQLNDHADSCHDAEVLADLRGVSVQASALLAELARHRARYASYCARLAEAVERAESGERDQVCGLTRDSFHTAWWQLHADLLLLLGRERTDEDT